MVTPSAETLGLGTSLCSVRDKGVRAWCAALGCIWNIPGMIPGLFHTHAIFARLKGSTFHSRALFNGNVCCLGLLGRLKVSVG